MVKPSRSREKPMPYEKTPDPLDRDVVLEFFWKFSVFECSLKREGFLRRGRYNTAEPDWKGFGEAIEGRFADVTIEGFAAAVDALESASPRRQVVRSGRLEWEPVVRQPGHSREDFVLRLVRTTRNNLFHGGKYPDGPVEEVARNKAILRAALKILEGCCELHPSLARWATAA
jgi:hypothetical protein